MTFRAGFAPEKILSSGGLFGDPLILGEDARSRWNGLFGQARRQESLAQSGRMRRNVFLIYAAKKRVYFRGRVVWNGL